MRSLLKSPAWDRLVEYAKEQIHLNEQDMRQPIEAKLASLADKGIVGMDGTLMLGIDEYTKGWIGGISLFLGIPQTLIDSNTAMIAVIEDQENDRRDETGNDPDRDAGGDLGDAGRSSP